MRTLSSSSSLIRAIQHLYTLERTEEEEPEELNYLEDMTKMNDIDEESVDSDSEDILSSSTD